MPTEIKIMASAEGKDDLPFEEAVPGVAEIYESDDEEIDLDAEANEDDVSLASSDKPAAIDEQSDETKIFAEGLKEQLNNMTTEL